MISPVQETSTASPVYHPRREGERPFSLPSPPSAKGARPTELSCLPLPVCLPTEEDQPDSHAVENFPFTVWPNNFNAADSRLNRNDSVSFPGRALRDHPVKHPPPPPCPLLYICSPILFPRQPSHVQVAVVVKTRAELRKRKPQVSLQT